MKRETLINSLKKNGFDTENVDDKQPIVKLMPGNDTEAQITTCAAYIAGSVYAPLQARDFVDEQEVPHKEKEGDKVTKVMKPVVNNQKLI